MYPVFVDKGNILTPITTSFRLSSTLTCLHELYTNKDQTITL